jgi:hypothetical protein
MTTRKVKDQHATASQSFGVAMLPALCASANILLLSFARIDFSTVTQGGAIACGQLLALCCRKSAVPASVW